MAAHPGKVDALVAAYRDEYEVYFALAMPPADKDLREDNRVESAEAAGIPGLWIEFDYDTPYRKKKGLPPDHELQAAIKTLPAPAPSLIVDSGGGYHCYWPFRDGPWIFQNGAERDEAQELVLGWQAELRRHVGFTVDSTHDLARVLRLPGTLNHKGDTPVDIVVKKDNGQGPAVEEWRAMATLWAPAPNSSRNGSTSRGSERSSGRRAGASATLDVSQDRSPNADDKALLIQVLPDVDRVLKHDPSKMKGINDKSANGCDLSLASYAAQARWELQRMSDLLIEHRRHLHPESHPKAGLPPIRTTTKADFQAGVRTTASRALRRSRPKTCPSSSPVSPFWRYERLRSLRPAQKCRRTALSPDHKATQPPRRNCCRWSGTER